MFFHRSNALANKLREIGSENRVGNSTPQLVMGFCSSEMPKDLSHFDMRDLDDIMNEADLGVQCIECRYDQTNKDVMRILGGSFIRGAFGKSICGSGISNPLINLYAQSGSASEGWNSSTRISCAKLNRMNPETGFKKKTASWNVRLLNDRNYDLSQTRVYGMQDALYDRVNMNYSSNALYLEFQEPNVPNGISMYHDFPSSGEYVDLSYQCSYETGTNYVQNSTWTDENWQNIIDQNANRSVKVRIRNVDAIPSFIISRISSGYDKSYLVNHCVLEKNSSGWWSIQSIQESHGWIQVAANRSYRNRVVNTVFTHEPSYADNAGYGRFIKIVRTSSYGGSNFDLDFDYIAPYNGNNPCTGSSSFNGGFKNYPYLHNGDTTAQKEVKWAFITYIGNNNGGSWFEPLKARPIMMLDVGGPNDGKAVALADKMVSWDFPPQLLNCKLKIGWLEGEAIPEPPTVTMESK